MLLDRCDPQGFCRFYLHGLRFQACSTFYSILLVRERLQFPSCGCLCFGTMHLFYLVLAFLVCISVLQPGCFERCPACQDYEESLEARRLGTEWASNVKHLQERYTNYWKDVSMGDPWEIGKTFISGQIFRLLDSKQNLLNNTMASLIYVNCLVAAFSFLFLGPRLGLLLAPCIALMMLVTFGIYGFCGYKIDPCRRF